MNKKVKAATILEIAVTMAISAIIITMAYSSYAMFSRLFYTFKRNNVFNADILLLDKMLRRDIDQAIVVTRNTSGTDMHHAGNVTVNYSWHEGYILRTKNDIQDTFYLAATDLKLGFEQQEQYLENQPVDKIEFVYSQDDEEPVRLLYEKQYAADIFMNQEK